MDTFSVSHNWRQRSDSSARSKASSTVSSSENNDKGVEFAKLSLLPLCPFWQEVQDDAELDTLSIRCGSFLMFSEKPNGIAKCSSCHNIIRCCCKGEDVKNTSDDERAPKKQWNAEIDRYEEAVEVAGLHWAVKQESRIVVPNFWPVWILMISTNK